MTTVLATPSILVRKACPATDMSWLMRELRVFASEYPARRSLISNDTDYIRRELLKLIDDHVVFVADGPAGPQGFIIGLVSPHYFNPAVRTLTELFWWVSPQHRRSRAGLLLLNAFTEWGTANVDWIAFGLEAQSPVNRRSMERRGFKLYETNYLLEV